MPVAPFQVVVLPINMKRSNVVENAERLYRQLVSGFDVLLDDRDQRAGFKFKTQSSGDADPVDGQLQDDRAVRSRDSAAGAEERPESSWTGSSRRSGSSGHRYAGRVVSLHDSRPTAVETSAGENTVGRSYLFASSYLTQSSKPAIG